MFVKKGDATKWREGERLRMRDFVPAGTTKGRSPSGGFAIALWKPSPDHSSNCMVTQRWQVAAALPAAVTTTQQQETAPNFQAEPSSQKRTRQTPAALRERGSGGEALLYREAASPPESPSLPFVHGTAPTSQGQIV